MKSSNIDRTMRFQYIAFGKLKDRQGMTANHQKGQFDLKSRFFSDIR